MAGGVWKKIDVVGTSPVSFTEATKVAVAEAAKSVRHLGWFEVVEMRGAIQGGNITEFQVTVQIGFKLEG